MGIAIFFTTFSGSLSPVWIGEIPSPEGGIPSKPPYGALGLRRRRPTKTSLVYPAASKTKTTIVDAYGSLVQLNEPNPAGGTFTTNYAYAPANQLTGVSMTRGIVTQNRTYLYSGSDLVTSTNPENGTVTYTYDQSHRCAGATDAIQL